MYEINQMIGEKYKIWLFDYFIKSKSNPNECFSEVAIYNTALDINEKKILQIFDEVDTMIKIFKNKKIKKG